MRPIRAPENPVRKCFDYRLCKRQDVQVFRWPKFREAFRATDLAVEIVVIGEELQKQFKFSAIDGQAHIRSSHMIHHDSAGQ